MQIKCPTTALSQWLGKVGEWEGRATAVQKDREVGWDRGREPGRGHRPVKHTAPTPAPEATTGEAASDGPVEG